MTDPSPPAWVSKRDGRLVPFEADRISRALFAAGESLGRPDAFLARELADGVVHFLAQESSGQTSTTEQIAEVVVKVVRELGHPALAAAFARHGETRQRRPRSLAEVRAALHRDDAAYTRDLRAAQQAGLLTLTDHDTPAELAGCVLELPASGDLEQALAWARRHVGQYVAVDGLEHLDRRAEDLAGALARGLERTGLAAVVNLNCGEPPSWADPLAEGPLFPDQARRVDPALRERRADELVEALASLGGPRARIDWHLGECDFTPVALPRLARLVRLAWQGYPVGFVLDRPRRPLALAEGLDRRHPAALVQVGLPLPALAGQPGMLADVDRFRQRLGSLARLALSVAVQKRDRIRRHAEADTAVRRGFLLDRARLVVAPVGLDEVAHLFTDWGLANGGTSLELGRQIVLRLRDVLRHDGRLVQLDTSLDGPFTLSLADGPVRRENVAGLTPWNETASLRSQLRAGGALHAVAEHGTLALFVPPDEAAGTAEVCGWLQQAWRQTEVVRLRLMGTGASGGA
jgi:hypothetical protein